MYLRPLYLSLPGCKKLMRRETWPGQRNTEILPQLPNLEHASLLAEHEYSLNE